MSPTTTPCTADPIWGAIFKCCFKAQSSKLKSLFSLKRGKRDVRALSFELSKMSPQVGLAVLDKAGLVGQVLLANGDTSVQKIVPPIHFLVLLISVNFGKKLFFAGNQTVQTNTRVLLISLVQ